ncbi:MAG: CARDB domain-containing protein [Bacteroidota bacterium]
MRFNTIAGEKIISNNANLVRDASGAAKKIHVIQPLLPDLTDTVLAAPLLVAAGQPVTVVHKVSNSGSGVTYPANFTDELWLSTDPVPGNGGDIWLYAKDLQYSRCRQAQSYNDTLTVTVNINTPAGNYFLITRTDAGNSVAESNDNNNP